MGMDKPGPRPLRKFEQDVRKRQSEEWYATLRRWLTIFTEHYRQQLTEPALMFYRTELAHLTPTQLEEACREAGRTSEFMPVVATILAAHNLLEMRRSDGSYLGPKLMEYPEITQEERDAAAKDMERLTNMLKAKLGIGHAVKPEGERVKVSPTPSGRTLERQKKILQDRGLLGPGATHNPKCLCPNCRRRRERS